MAKQKLITSVINHNIRVELDLTCDEYIVMDILLENYCKQPFDLMIIGNSIGIDATEFNGKWVSLIEKKLIFFNPDSPIQFYIISDKWLSKFNVDQDFNEFWNLFREYGNKAKSLENYKKVRKSVDKDELHTSAQRYLQYCDETYSDTKFVNACQVWLDPSKKRWEDKLKMSAVVTAEPLKKQSYSQI